MFGNSAAFKRGEQMKRRLRVHSLFDHFQREGIDLGTEDVSCVMMSDA